MWLGDGIQLSKIVGLYLEAEELEYWQDLEVYESQLCVCI